MNNFSRGDRVVSTMRIPATIVGFHEFGYYVKRDDGSMWIYVREYTAPFFCCRGSGTELDTELASIRHAWEDEWK